MLFQVRPWTFSADLCPKASNLPYNLFITYFLHFKFSHIHFFNLHAIKVKLRSWSFYATDIT